MLLIFRFLLLKDVIKKVFQLPDNLEPINILAIGYGKGIAEDSERHLEIRISMEELVPYDYLRL